MNCGGCFDLDFIEKELIELRTLTSEDGFWNEPSKAQQITAKISNYENTVREFEGIKHSLEEGMEYLELAEAEDDDELYQEAKKILVPLSQKVERLTLRSMLNGEDDSKNAILTIHPGAGGTESQDWADMLMRMYLRYIEQSGRKANIIDLLKGEEAGIKDVIIEVSGNYAYGYLKAEAGIHRLVRISPFDSNARRHTSFASVFIYPEVDDTIEIEINPQDLRIDTYRASGAGGQHVNKTDSAIRITHIPSGIVVQCQNERSQHKNKESAMKLLKARLYQKQKEEREKEKEKVEQTKTDIAWGHQIRSYVFQPYTMVKDHRTNLSTGNIQAVMDGNLDEFIDAFLSMQAKRR